MLICILGCGHIALHYRILFIPEYHEGMENVGKLPWFFIRSVLYAIAVVLTSEIICPRSNILQESLIKLVEACNDHSNSMDRWLSKLEASNWQSHVKEILTTACLAAQCIDRSVFDLCSSLSV